MMFQKSLPLLTIFILLLVGCSKLIESDIKVINSDITLENNEVKNEGKIVYSFTLSNNENVRIVDSVHIIPTAVIKNYDSNVKNQSIEYQEDKLKISGEITYSTTGLTKDEVSNYEPYIKAIQFIGDDNKEHFLLNNN